MLELEFAMSAQPQATETKDDFQERPSITGLRLPEPYLVCSRTHGYYA